VGSREWGKRTILFSFQGNGDKGDKGDKGREKVVRINATWYQESGEEDFHPSYR
jgi:hypothetical protein